MLDLVRRFSPAVEYYSIDEMFFDAQATSLGEAKALRVPTVLAQGSDFLVLEWIDSRWVASVEWFIAPTFSVSGGMEVFDYTSVSGSFRLHF